MTATIVREFTFEAAHHLPRTPEGHKCRRLHGHSFRCEVHVRGPVSEASGWVQDFADVRAAYEPLRDQLDHHYLNEVEDLDNPTSENIARWIWQRLEPRLPGLCTIIIHETCDSRCIYTGEE